MVLQYLMTQNATNSHETSMVSFRVSNRMCMCVCVFVKKRIQAAPNSFITYQKTDDTPSPGIFSVGPMRMEKSREVLRFEDINCAVVGAIVNQINPFEFNDPPFGRRLTRRNNENCKASHVFETFRKQRLSRFSGIQKIKYVI